MGFTHTRPIKQSRTDPFKGGHLSGGNSSRNLSNPDHATIFVVCELFQSRTLTRSKIKPQRVLFAHEVFSVHYTSNKM